MRYYRFAVGGKSFELNEKNPFEVRLEFDITATDNVTYSRPTIISLYNVSLDFFTLAKQFKDTPMILQAGVKRQGFGRKQGLENSLEDTLFLGLVDDVLTSWEGKETVVRFLGRTLPSLNYKNSSLYYVSTIEAGQAVSKVFSQVIARYLVEMKKAITITIDSSTLSITSKQKQTLPIRPPKEFLSGLRYFNSILSKFNLVITQEDETLTITTKDTLTRSTLAGIARIDKTSLLSQPTYENYETVSLQLALNGKYRLNQYIMLPTDVPLAAGSINSIGGVVQRAVNNNGFLIMQGVFLTTEVHHIGDSRNQDPMSWATNILCVRQVRV